MTGNDEAGNAHGYPAHALDAYIEASVEQLLNTPTAAKGRDTVVYLGNWHVAFAKILLQDPVLRPEDKIVIMNIMVSASPGAVAAFPSYEYLGGKSNIRGRATIADALAVARITRWITLCRRVRDARGRWRGNIYALHDEPLSLADTVRLDADYMQFLNRCCTHRRHHVRRLAEAVLATIEDHAASGRDVTAAHDPLERRMAALRALQPGMVSTGDSFYSLSAEALSSLKAGNRHSPATCAFRN